MINETDYLPSLSEEIYFLLVCAQSKHAKEDILYTSSYIQKNQFNLETIIGLATSHGILPLVYKAVKESLKDVSATNIHILPTLKLHYISIVQRNMSMSSELIKLLHTLKEEHIKAIAFKGPTLSQMAYGDITLRQYGDIDILIKDKDRRKVIDIMTEAGYIPEIILNSNAENTFFTHVNVIAFYHPISNIRIEIHWELLSKNYAISWEESSLWETQTSIDINNYQISILSIEHLLLYLCAHSAKHLYERLEWICDIDRSVRANPDIDWKRINSEASKLGLTRIVYLSLALCETLFALELPKMMKEESQKDSVMQELKETIIKQNFGQTTSSKKSYSHFILLWKMREKFSDKLRFAFLGIFTPKFDDFLFIQLPNQLSFLYILFRPYRLIRKYLISK